MMVRSTLVEAVEAAHKNRVKQREFIAENSSELARVANGLEVISEYLMRISFDNTRSVNVNVSGDHHVFLGMFKALRSLGYDSSDKPKEEKIAAWSSYWHHKDHKLRLWITFTSTSCKRVKIGTTMVEQDVYETVCD